MPGEAKSFIYMFIKLAWRAFVKLVVLDGHMASADAAGRSPRSIILMLAVKLPVLLVGDSVSVSSGHRGRN